MDPAKLFKVLIRYKDLCGEQTSLETLKRFLSGYRRDAVLERVARCGAILVSKRYDDVETQRFLCKSNVSHEWANKVNSWIKKHTEIPDPLIFVPAQLRILSKTALIGASDSPTSIGFSSSAEVATFSPTYFMASDLLDPHLENNEYNIPQHCSAVIRSYLASDIQPFKHTLPRYWDLLVDFPKEIPPLPSHLDLQDVFQRIVGVSLLDFLSIGIALMVPIIRTTPATFESAHIGVDMSSFFKGATIEGGIIDQVCNILSSDAKTASAEAQKTHFGAPFDYDFVFALQRPFVRFGQTLIPFSIEIAAEKVTGGVYWIFMDGLEPAARLRFMRYFGELFQEYVYRRILLPKLGNGICLPGLFAKGRQEKEATDIIIVDPPHIFFIECKTARLRYGTKTTGDLQLFDEDLEDGYLKALRQLDAAVTAFRNGDLDKTIGISQTQFSRVWPVVLLLEQFPLDPILYEYLDAKRAKLKLLAQPGVAPPCIMSMDELEICESLMQSGISLASLIREKVEDDEYAKTSFRNFLFYKHHKAFEVHNIRLRAKSEEFMTLVVQRLLKGSQEDPQLKSL